MEAFEHIIGNSSIKLQLLTACQAAIINNTSVKHTILAGPPGCGKTTFAKAIAAHIGTSLLKVPPEAIKKPEDVLELANQMNVEGYQRDGSVVGQIKPSVVFIDEIHKLSLAGQEALGICLEEFYQSIKNKFNGQVAEYWIPRFTLVGATTQEGKLSKPLRDRFGLHFILETYSEEESFQIVRLHAAKKDIRLTDEAAQAIAVRGRGVPRILVGLLERCQDVAVVLGREILELADIENVFQLLEIDPAGLNKNDIKLLKCLYKAGIPVGLDTLAITLDQSPKDIQNSREPYLIQKGFMIRTGRGRMLSPAGAEYLKKHGYVEDTRRFASDY